MIFLPTPSARRATHRTDHCLRRRAISTHALREEGDVPADRSFRASLHFYPRPPRGGRQIRVSSDVSVLAFLPTPSARRATRGDVVLVDVLDISTHALREEGDLEHRADGRQFADFYPRPPRGGRRHRHRRDRLPGRISTHALREEGDVEHFGQQRDRQPISTHALREEGDSSTMALWAPGCPFLPTPSARRATEHFGQQRDRQPISTHALREEGDISSEWGTVAYRAFLPTPSARRATGVIYDMFSESEFLPTPSARRATANVP